MFQKMLQGGGGSGTLDTFNFVGNPVFISDDTYVNVEIGKYYLLATYRLGTDELTVEGGDIVCQIQTPIYNSVYNPHYERLAIVKATSNQLRAYGFIYAIVEINL